MWRGRVETVIFSVKEWFEKLFKQPGFFQGTAGEYLFKKYKGHFFIILCLMVLSFVSKILPGLLKTQAETLSLDSMVPKDFVLLPIEISNGKDIIGLMGKYGVVDLYAYSDQTGLPEKQAGGAIKILPPETEDGRFVALVPEKEALGLFEYSNPFYAVVQNPNKSGAKIYKRKKRPSLVVIEEDF